jgi:hypothetical protein
MMGKGFEVNIAPFFHRSLGYSKESGLNVDECCGDVLPDTI